MTPRTHSGPTSARTGAALIEASLVMAFMCLVLFGALQLSTLFAAREIIDYAAMNGARARTVGFNSFMVDKVVRVSAIPNAGRMRTPETMPGGGFLEGRTERPGVLWDEALRARAPLSEQSIIERQRIPFYLAEGGAGELPAILDYENWNSIRYTADYAGPDQLRVMVRQEFPLNFPMSGAFYQHGTVQLRSGDTGARMAYHSSLYLE